MLKALKYTFGDWITILNNLNKIKFFFNTSKFQLKWYTY
jgi:hypothetical protein